MPFATRSTTATGSSGTVTATHSNPTPLDSSYGHIAIVKRGTATDPGAVSGWTQLAVGGASSSAGLWVYVKQGDGTVNSFSMPSATTSTAVLLQSYPCYDIATFATVYTNGSGGSGVTSRNLAAGEVSTEDHQYGVAVISAASTFGSTPAYTNGYTWQAGGNTSTFTWAEKDLHPAGTTANTTVSWTTSRAAIGIVVVISTVSPTKSGGATGSVTLGNATVAGSRASSGAASGAVALGNATTAGSRSSSGSAAGSVALGNAAVAGSRASAGAAAGAVVLGNATAAGSRLSSGAAAGAVAIGPGVVDGSAPSIGAPSGGATGSVTLGNATVTGSRPSVGAASGSVTLGNPSVAGSRASRGSATGSVLFGPGSVDGVAPAAALPSRLSVVALTPTSTLVSPSPILTLEPR